MAWNPNTPQANQFISVTQPLIEGNFQALDAWTQVDHTQVASGATDGMHTGIHMLSQINSPDTTAANMIGLVCGQGPVSLSRELFFIPNNTPSALINTFKPWTEFRTPTLGGNDGYFYVAGGRLLVKFNLVDSDGTNPRTYTYTAGPAFLGGSEPVVFLQGVAGAAGLQVGLTNSTAVDFVITTFTPAGIGAPANFNFVAIGVPA